MDKKKSTKIIGWIQIGFAAMFLVFGQTDFHIGIAAVMIGQGLVTLKIID